MKAFLWCVLFVLASVFTRAANYYWIGGTGNWSDINHWATTSGGATLHSFVPSQNDDVFFDAGSGFTAGSRIVTVNTNATCRNMYWSGALNNPVLTGTFNLNIYGSALWQNAMTYSVTNTYFTASTLGNSLTTNGASLGNAGSSFFFSGTGGWVLQDNFTSPGNIAFLNGNLNTNGVTVNVQSFIENTALPTRTLTLGSSQIYVSTNSASGAFSYTGNVLNAGTSHIHLTGSFVSYGFVSFLARSGHVYYDISFTNPASTGATFLNSTVSNLKIHTYTMLGSGVIFGNSIFDHVILGGGERYAFESAKTQTITTSLTATSTACSIGLTDIGSTNLNTQASISFSAGATATITNALLTSINATGAIIPITAVNSFDNGNNNNINFTAFTSNSLYWIGGSGNWNDPSHWSATSGGAGGVCIPSPNDDVFFDANSGFSAGNALVSLPGMNQYCRNMTWSGAPATPTITGALGNNFLNIYGSVTLQAAMVYSVQETWLKSTSMGRTITTNGNQIQGDFNFFGNGGWILQDNFNSLKSINFNKGNLNTNHVRIDADAFAARVGTGYINVYGPRTLTLGASQIYIASRWIYYSPPAPTLNSGTSHIYILSNLNGSIGFDAQPGHIYHDLTFTNPASNNMVFMSVFGGGITVRNLTFMGSGTINFANTITNLTLSPGKKYILDDLQQTISGSLIANSPSCTGSIEIISILTGSQATFSFSPGATANINNTIMKDIRAIGSGIPISALNSIDMGNNTNISFTSSPGTNMYWIGGLGDWNDGTHWSFSSGGASAFCIPGPNDNVFFDANSGFAVGNNTVTLNGSNHYCKDMTWNGAASTPVLTGGISNMLSIFGSLTLQAAMQFNAALVYFKATTAGKTITTNGNVMNVLSGGFPYSGYYFDGTGSWTMMDHFISSRYLIFLKGNLNTNGMNFQISNFLDDVNLITTSSTASTRTLTLGSSKVTMTANYWVYKGPNTVLNTSPGCQITFTTGFGYFYGQNGHTYKNVSNINAIGTTFIGVLPAVGSMSFQTVSFKGNADISGAHRMDTLILNAGKVYRLESARTNTVTGKLYVSGNPCFITFLQSLTPGARANLNVQAGSVNYDFLNVRDIDATPSYTTLNAAGHSTDAGNNVNIAFAPTSTVAIAGLGPDITRCQYNLPLTLYTQDFYPNPFTQYSWTGAGTGTADTLVVNSGGTYSITVNYGAGCTVSDAITITANPTPTVAITGNTVICSGATATLTAGGAGTYTWTSLGVNTNTAQVSPSTNTSYSVVGTSTAGCLSAQAVVQVSVNPTPTIAIASISSPSVCSGNTATITPGGAGTYTLLPGNISGNTFTVSPTGNTTYTISGTSAANCPSQNTAQQLITVSASPTVNIASISSPSVCSGNTATITPGGASTYTLQPGNTTGTSFTVSPSANTTYTISGTSAANCPSQNTAQQLITVSASPTVNIASVSSPSVCSGNTATITPGGASTYTLQPGNIIGTSFSVTPSANTTYTISGTSAANCPSQNTAQQLITVSASPTVNIASVSSPSVCSGNTATITPGGAGTYTLLPGNISGTTFTVSPTGNTTYTISGTSAANCPSQNTAQQLITVSASPTVNIASVSSPSVCSGNTATITPGGAGTYILLPGNISGTTFTVSPTGNTTYTISGTSAANCPSQNTAQQLITVSASPTVNIASVSSPSVCSGNTATITPGGAGTYTLLPGNISGTTFTVSPTGNTTYTISGTSAANCPSQNTAQQLITVSASPTVNIASVSSPSVCSGNTATITPGGAGTYTLSPGNISGTTFTVSPTGNTTYTISGTSAANCPSQNTAQQLITVSASPTVNIASVSSPSVCSGNTATITPGGASTYTLQPGNTTGTSFTVSPSGNTTYTIIGSSTANCPSQNGAQQVITVSSNPLLTVTSINQVSCFGLANGSVILTPSGGSGGGYVISPSGTTNLSPGSYTYTLTDANNCISTAAISVTQPTAALSAVISATTANTSCTLLDGTASVSINGGTPSYTVTWDNGAIGATVTNLNSGVHTYTVVDARGCTQNTGSLTIPGVTGISATVVSQSSVTCFGGMNGALSYTTSGGSSYTYTLVTATSSQTNTTGSFTNLPANTYSVYVVENSSGCIDTEVITLSAPSSSVTASVNTSNIRCYGNTATVSSTANGGTPGYQYSWSSNPSVSSTATYPAGTYSLTVIDANNCAAPVQVFTISQPAAPLTASVTTTNNISCSNPVGSAVVVPNGGTGATTILWSSGKAVNSYTNTGLAAGPVTYTITDANGCTLSGVVTINGVAMLAVSSADITDVTCHGESTGALTITMTGGTPNYTYSWSNTGSNVASQSGLAAGVYVVTVSDLGNCSITRTLTVAEPAPLTATVASSSASCPDTPTGAVEISVSGGTPSYNVLWGNGQSGASLSGVPAGTVVANITDSRNCRMTYRITIPEKSCKEIFIPEMVTPNGDGKNDKLVITKIEEYPNNRLNIFNRWGSAVYIKDSYNNEFDGSPNVGNSIGNGLLPSGTYYVVLDFGDGKTKTYTGYIELQY